MIKKMALIIPLVLVLGAGFLIGRIYKSSSSVPVRHVVYYVDPMHPAYRSAKPGIAPDCGMALIPVYAESVGESIPAQDSTHSGFIHVDSTTRQLYGIELATVKKGSGDSLLRVYGKVAADETRIYRVNMGTDGYVKETANDLIGNHVTKNQHLALVYSPEFLSVAGGYLSANERTPASNEKEASLSQNTTAAKARADRLRNLGMSDVQIEEISSSRKIPEDVYVVSPTDGFIISRNISPGLRFERHDELYRIADLSQVWVIAETFGKDADAFRHATEVHVILSDTGETFVARVSDVLPELDPVTHALNVRLEVANPRFHLRPGMFVEIYASALVMKGLSIPLDSVINTGLVKRVFVENGDGNFEAREIQTGRTFGDNVQVTDGLQEGEKVVSSGSFLIDSESHMHSAVPRTHMTNSTSVAETRVNDGVR